MAAAAAGQAEDPAQDWGAGDSVQNPQASDGPHPGSGTDQAKGGSCGDMRLSAYLHKLVKSVVSRVHDLKAAHPSRPIILAGWGAAAAINCQVHPSSSTAH